MVSLTPRQLENLLRSYSFTFLLKDLIFELLPLTMLHPYTLPTSCRQGLVSQTPHDVENLHSWITALLVTLLGHYLADFSVPLVTCQILVPPASWILPPPTDLSPSQPFTTSSWAQAHHSTEPEVTTEKTTISDLNLVTF